MFYLSVVNVMGVFYSFVSFNDLIDAKLLSGAGEQLYCTENAGAHRQIRTLHNLYIANTKASSAAFMSIY